MQAAAIAKKSNKAEHTNLLSSLLICCNGAFLFPLELEEKQATELVKEEQSTPER